MSWSGWIGKERRSSLALKDKRAVIRPFYKGLLPLSSSIESWLEVLKEDKRAIFRAAAQAQKAHEWIMAQVDASTEAEREAA